MQQITEGSDYTVFGVPKDRAQDMTEGRGREMRGMVNVTFDEALDYADRNDSPDNPERYVIRDRDGRQVRV